MTSENFKKWNLILGWTTFAIALITYSLTLEPTVSAWDCGEYISTSVKLEVGHPPGAPLFQMLGAFFAMFTSELTEIAKMVNFMSALASAFTILFMFWTITNLTQKLIKSKDDVVIEDYLHNTKGNSLRVNIDEDLKLFSKRPLSLIVQRSSMNLNTLASLRASLIFSFFSCCTKFLS